MRHPPIILKERINLLLVGAIPCGQAILRTRCRQAEEDIRNGVSTATGLQVFSELPTHIEQPERSLRLEEVSSEVAEIPTEFECVFSVNQTHSIGNLTSVIDGELW